MPNNRYPYANLGFLETEPEILYQGLVGTQGSQNFLDYWRKQYANVWGKYLGRIGSMALGGQVPSVEEPLLSFYDYLMQQPSFQQQWAGLVPGQRGERQPGRTFWNIPR